MSAHGSSFVILKQVDSTNNYAMALVHEGLAKHGEAVFAHQQTQGKGQRGKVWQTGIDENIALSIILKPKQRKILLPFQLSATIALAVFDFFSKYAGEEVTIKWPNDIYWRDRKAGGILIENVISGSSWKWAVAGIGININQTIFDENLKDPVSLKQITGEHFDTLALARELHQIVLLRLNEGLTKPYELLLEEYQQRLFRINQLVRLKKNNIVFETKIKGISPDGKLLTQDIIDNEFEFGEIEWIL
ncbi:MAG: biotin--[acetyl-CoA-carboxylase] ligase [Ferruginibacter sp.]